MKDQLDETHCKNMEDWKEYEGMEEVVGVEDGGPPVPAEPGGVDAKEALAGPGEGGWNNKVLVTITNT
jgi:hypothetical protein